MHIRHVSSSRTVRRALASAGIVGLALGAAACGSDDSGSGGSGSAAATTRSASPSSPRTRPTRSSSPCRRAPRPTRPRTTSTSPSPPASRRATTHGQIDAIEHAIARGDKGILITPMSTGVNAAIKKARDAGPLRHRPRHPARPAGHRRHHLRHGQPRGRRARSASGPRPQLDGEQATIALLDLFNDKIVSVDYDRDQGFLEGMGIDVADPKKNGDEAKTGKYTGGKGGDYTIVCNEPSNGAEDGGRTAMETCLTKNPTSTWSTRSTSRPRSAPRRP